MPDVKQMDMTAKENDPEIDEEGYDISLIREMLRKTPDERLDWHQQLIEMIEELRNALSHGCTIPHRDIG
jgi:hypothetical protein